MIAGWSKPLQLMNAGSKWRLRTERTGLWRPGRRQHSPHSVLVFDVELLEIL